jgi:hypothetical protein
MKCQYTKQAKMESPVINGVQLVRYIQVLELKLKPPPKVEPLMLMDTKVPLTSPCEIQEEAVKPLSIPGESKQR